jgi:hypothetical protein
MGSARGALLAAAIRLGIEPVEYAHRTVTGEKWCTGCKAWHDIDVFGPDPGRPDGRAALCPAARRQRYQRTYVRAGHPGPFGPAPAPARDGDKDQARHRVNVLVRTGRLPHPNRLPCVDCDHVWAAGERRHEYDHYAGYGADAHLKVEPVCSRCHHRREDLRVREYPTNAVTAS